MIEKHLIVSIILLSLNINSAQALTIIPDYDNFTGIQLEVLKSAVKAWSDAFKCPDGCSDGRTIKINFSKDPTLDSQGYGTTYFEENGDVNYADVQLNTTKLEGGWTTGSPNPGFPDAMGVAMHEIGHALGFINVPGASIKFDAKVVNLDSGDTFYDMNGDGKFNGNDFDLANQDASHSGDWENIMSAVTIDGKRFYPDQKVIMVLADAYKYCTPEPATMLLFGTGIVVLAAVGRRKRN